MKKATSVLSQPRNLTQQPPARHLTRSVFAKGPVGFGMEAYGVNQSRKLQLIVRRFSGSVLIERFAGDGLWLVGDVREADGEVESGNGYGPVPCSQPGCIATRAGTLRGTISPLFLGFENVK